MSWILMKKSADHRNSKQTNCLSEVLLSQAFDRATELDNHLATTGTTVGPLHGLPVSVKDQFRVEGAETSIGFVGLLGKDETKESESEAIKILKEAGAVVFVKTNVPSGMMVSLVLFCILLWLESYSGDEIPPTRLWNQRRKDKSPFLVG